MRPADTISDDAMLRFQVTLPVAESAHPTNRLCFAEFELDPRSHELRRGGRVVRIQQKPALLLETLVTRAGEVVTREELARALWPADTFVDFDNSLNNAVSRVRAALGDSVERPRFVETVGRLGYRFIGTLAAPRSAPGSPVAALQPPSRRGRTTAVLQAVAGALASGVALTAVLVGPRPLGPPPDREKVMLAVLPFENLDADPAQEYFSDGLTVEMIAQLGTLYPASLGVIARTTAMQYKKTSKRVDQIAEETGAQYLLEGGVRRSAGHLRITVRLFQARDQTPFWGRGYDAPIRDVLTVQKDVARSVVDEIRIRLSPQARARLDHVRPVDAEGYEAYLRGRLAWDRRTADSLREAIEHFDAAAARDAGFAPFHAGRADAYSLLPYYANVPARAAFPPAKTAALRAVELDPADAEARTSLAYVLHHYDWQWSLAEAEYRRAVSLNPSYATAHHWYAEFLVIHGRLDEARRHLADAHRVDPLSPRVGLDLALPDFFEGNVERMVSAARRVLDRDPGFLPAHVALREAYERQGRFPDAARELGHLTEAAGLGRGAALDAARAYAAEGPHGYWRVALKQADRGVAPLAGAVHRAALHAALGQRRRALDLLEQAYQERDDELLWIGVDDWESVRDDPRFGELLRKIGLDKARPGPRMPGSAPTGR